MSMRDSSRHYTICEVLRELNDLHQNGSDHDKLVRQKRALAESMAKRMSKKLLEYNKEVYKDWWKRNHDHMEDLERRISEKYIVEDPC